MSCVFNLKFIHLRDGAEFAKPDCALVLALGNFDGVHLGHRALIKKAAEEAAKMRTAGKNVRAGIWCFSLPPADYLSVTPPAHICTLEDKLSLAGECGAEYAVIGDFDELRDVSPDGFINLLRDECGCAATVCGFNFRFGKNGAGSAETLNNAYGKMALTVPAITYDGVPISSSRIRVLLYGGKTEQAEFMLGHPFYITGEVIHGKKLGRKLGLPTANLAFDKKMLVPAEGIYASGCEIDGKTYAAVSNIGCRPTVDTSGIYNCETHIFGFSDDIYGKKIKVELYRKLRDEMKFGSIDELRRAIENDARGACEYYEKRNNCGGDRLCVRE